MFHLFAGEKVFLRDGLNQIYDPLQGSQGVLRREVGVCEITDGTKDRAQVR
jgi:hypothetical protein